MDNSTNSDLSLQKKPIPRGYAKQVEREIIDARKIAVAQNPHLKTSNRWDLSDIFYNARKRLDAEGYDVRPLNDEKTKMRKKLYHYVKEYCDTLGIKRHDIGIFAADRAVLYFQGREYSVNFENYQQLADLGTDIICVEKEGTAVKSEPYTRALGVALLQSQGFIAEYGKMLSEAAAKKGAHVIILTDFDSSGVEIGYVIEGIVRLGIDLDTIDRMNRQKDENGKKYETLNPLKLLESYNGGSHWNSLNNLVNGYYISDHEKTYAKYLRTLYKFSNGHEAPYIDFLHSYRIELNTVMDEVGAERFWRWVQDALIKKFPTRDYNRAIDVPDTILTPRMESFNEELESVVRHILMPTVSETKNKLSNTKGLINTEYRLREIESKLLDVLSAHPLIPQIDLGLKALQKQIADCYQEEE
ncbi:MAG: hypothetical protein WBP88_12420 [Nitrososphaeraceae archaeon]